MASETSELTFVRCPSCRSLVPASATRCRICNALLEGGAKASDGDGARGGSRVRQRTISANVEDLLASKDGDVAAPSAPPVVEPPASGASHQEMEVDPLSAFLQEVEADDHVEPAPANVAATSVPAAEEHDDLDALFGEIDDFSAAAPAVTPPPPPAAPAEEAYDAAGDDLEDFMATLESELDGDIASAPFVAPPLRDPAPVEPPPPPPPPPAPERPKVEAKPPPPPKQQPQQRQPQQDTRGGRDQRGSHNSGERRDNGRADQQRNDRRGEESRKGGHNHGGKHHERQPERAEERHHERSQTQAAGPKTGRMRPGRLFGWLVSFESPDGRAIELREGKFFVTGTSIRGTDLVVEDPSISTPHALMSVSSDNGLMIQDLMSDRGVFVRSGDRGQYQREDGPVEVRHGDWVRFGDVEFLVTVVPSGN